MEGQLFAHEVLAVVLRVRDRRPDGRRVTNQEAADAIMLAVAALLPPAMRGVYADVDGLRERLEGVWEPAAPTGAAGHTRSAR